MRRIASRFTTHLFALLFAASLTFGVSSVFANPPTGAAACKNAPPTFLGACVSPDDCQRRCVLEGGFQGDCISNGTELCCICAI